jgi:hypothetical protein
MTFFHIFYNSTHLLEPTIKHISRHTTLQVIFYLKIMGNVSGAHGFVRNLLISINIK